MNAAAKVVSALARFPWRSLLFAAAFV